jgi:hypothetical protein
MPPHQGPTRLRAFSGATSYTNDTLVAMLQVVIARSGAFGGPLTKIYPRVAAVADVACRHVVDFAVKLGEKTEGRCSETVLTFEAGTGVL